MPMIYDKLLKSEWYNSLTMETDKVINATYEKYKPYYEEILKFIKQNEYIISNLELLLGNDILLDKPLQIFVLDPVNVSSTLFRQLCNKFGKEFSMRTEIPEKHYSIDHITKHYIRISYINQFKNKSLIEYLTPVKIKDFLVLPPILELIDIYKNIYNPEYAEEWASMIDKVKIIKKITDNNIRQSIIDFKGGKEDVSDRKKTEEILRSLKKILLQFLKEYTDYILINRYDNDTKNILILSQNAILTDLDRINRYLAKQDSDYTIIYKKKNLFIGKDMRISKYTIYVVFAPTNEFVNNQRPLLDIYNNLEYELVPYYKDANGLRIAHDWVTIRFYYIEIWNILAAYQLEMLTYDKFAKYTNNIFQQIDEMKINWSEPPTEYMGIYINEFQAFKQVMIKQGKNTRIYC